MASAQPIFPTRSLVASRLTKRSLALGRVAFSRRSHHASRVFLGGPGQQRVKGRAQRLPPIGQRVFNLRRHLMMNDAADDAIGLHLPQLLDEHLLRHRRDRPFQIREAQDPPAEQMEEDREFPAAFEPFERLFNAISRRFPRVAGNVLTFW